MGTEKGKAYKILVKGDLRGPYKESSILNGIRSGMVPLTARLLDLETNQYIKARELISDKDKTVDFDHTIPLFDGEF